MAIQAKSQEFIAHRSVQNVLTHLWAGKLTYNNGIKATIYVSKRRYKHNNNYKFLKNFLFIAFNELFDGRAFGTFSTL